MIVESLEINYGACPTASTIVEQMFCWVQPIVSISNKSEQSANCSIQQVANVRGGYVRELAYIQNEGKKRQRESVDGISLIRTRPLRNKSCTQKYNKYVKDLILTIKPSTSE